MTASVQLIVALGGGWDRSQLPTPAQVTQKPANSETAIQHIYRRTARNFNPNAATCGRITVAEAEIIVEPGELGPDEIHTPGIFVHRLVHNPTPEKRIEKRTTRVA
jgi:hypothetical protein